MISVEKQYKKAKDLFFENNYKKALNLLKSLPKIDVFISFYIGECEMRCKAFTQHDEYRKNLNKILASYRRLMPKFIEAYEDDPKPEHKFIIGYLYTSEYMKKYYDFDKGFQMLRHAAKDGYAPAQDEYARLIQYKIVVNPDLLENDKINYYKAAIINYEKAAKQGYGMSCYHLAECYSYGYLGVKINPAIAMKYYKEGAKHNFLVCHTDIASRILYDKTIVDKKEAFEYLLQASKQGYARADRFLAICYYNGYGCEQNTKAAIRIAKKSAKNGHVQSNLVLYNIYREIGNNKLANKYGKEYYNGLGELRNNLHMRKFYYEHIATCFAEGIGTRKNIPKAIKYYKIGAEKPYNYTLCLNKLSKIYLDKNSKYYSWLDGKNCLVKSVEKNDSWAICRIGQIYEEDENIHKAKQYYKIGVENNVPEACYHLGLIYAKEGGKKDRAAIDLLQNAYNAGIESAFLPLEKLNNKYSNGNTSRQFISIEDLNKIINKSKDAMLNVQALEAINTAVIIYKRLREHDCGRTEKVDYSPVITLLSKAVEIEFKKYFKNGYIKFLCEKHEKAIDYRHVNGLVVSDRYNNLCEFDIEGIKAFTMGDIVHCMNIVGPEKVTLDRVNKMYSIPFANEETNRLIFKTQSFVDYFDFIFKKDAFDVKNRRQELLHYLYNLHDDLLFLKDFLRNSAVHTSCMNIYDANLAIDLILISKKMLFDFKEKIKDNYK